MANVLSALLPMGIISGCLTLAGFGLHWVHVACSGEVPSLHPASLRALRLSATCQQLPSDALRVPSLASQRVISACSDAAAPPRHAAMPHLPPRCRSAIASCWTVGRRACWIATGRSTCRRQSEATRMRLARRCHRAAAVWCNIVYLLGDVRQPLRRRASCPVETLGEGAGRA